MTSNETIKSGPEIVSNFLETIKASKEANEQVVDALSTLISENKFTRTRLLNALGVLRDDSANQLSANGLPKSAT